MCLSDPSAVALEIRLGNGRQDLFAEHSTKLPRDNKHAHELENRRDSSKPQAQGLCRHMTEHLETLPRTLPLQVRREKPFTTLVHGPMAVSGNLRRRGDKKGVASGSAPRASFVYTFPRILGFLRSLWACACLTYSPGPIDARPK